MKVACITYRSWAEKIYLQLEKKYTEHEFLICLKKEDFDEEKLRTFKPDLILWYGWSWIVSKDFTDNYESIMLHPSPLPKYRGGSPIQNQIINGEKMSAVTLFKMTEKLDDGDIYVQEPISMEGYIEDIFDRISEVGFIGTCKIIDGDYELRKQDHSKATYVKRRKPKQSEITLEEIQTKNGAYLYNKIRMLTGPYPRAYITTADGRKLYIDRATLED